jgi:hypothetical protein
MAPRSRDQFVHTAAWVASIFSGRIPQPAGGSEILCSTAHVVSALSGLVLCTYTGVLLGATAIPAWSENASLLPVHFGVSGLGSAVSLLQLAGHESDPALRKLGILSAAAETVVDERIEIQSKRALRPVKEGPSGWMTRAAGLLSGPVPRVLRLVAGRKDGSRAASLRRWAAASTIAGSVLTRFAWVKAGQASARDPKMILEKPAVRSSSTCESRDDIPSPSPTE